MKNIIAGVTFLFAMIACLTVSAQEAGGKNKIYFKPPKVNTYLGLKSNGDSVIKEVGAELVKLPLIIKDEKGNVYKIVTYRLLYKRKGYIQNPETGKIETHFTTVADRFDSTPLPKVWIDNIDAGIKPDEQFYFFEILVQDKEGRKFYAPDLRLTIKQ